MPMPHDLVDLQLAPVALAINQELEALGRLEPDALVQQLLIISNRRLEDATDQSIREAMLVTAVTRSVDLHGWEVSCDPRGLRMSHGGHCVVIGIPDGIREFVEAVPI